MPENSAQAFREALSNCSPEWDRWCVHCQQVFNGERIPSGIAVVRDLVAFLRLRDQKRGSARLQAIRRLFGIWEATGMPVRQAHGWAIVGKDPKLPLFEQSLLIKTGDASRSRQRFLEAHETAHFFYAGLATLLPIPERDKAVFTRSLEAERFCWAFAMEILCPEWERREWTVQSVNEALSPREQEAIPNDRNRSPVLSYHHLRALARKHEMSVRAIIAALDRMPILDEAKCGIAVFAYKANRATGRETGHRVWQAARPSWGHIIVNQRADKQGFAQAGQQFDDGRSQESTICNETLRLNWKATGERKWRTHIFQSEVAYTPVDVTNEGRYLVAVWSWPKLPPS